MNEAQSTSPKCSRCGTALPPNAPEGLCPRCVVALNMATETDVQGGESSFTHKPPQQPLPPPCEIAKLFPQLEILETLGRGGMGAVYKARQPRLDRLVALKILSPEKQGDPKFSERFEREARTLARLKHPNIVTIYDFGEVQGNFYLLMEFVDGLTLRQLLQTRKLSPNEALAIVPQICEALQYAHQQGVVHRDIKPENILLDQRGEVKIADFGIAKIVGQQAQIGSTQEKQVIGTPHYMAPEQIEKPQTVDHRADIYSLGVVFYEMLTGELPLGRFQPPSSCTGGVQIDVRLDEVVLRALEKEPERRYQQAGQVKSDVETIATTWSCQPSTQNQNGRKNMQTRSNKSLWIGLAIGAACFVLVILVPFGARFLSYAKPNSSQLEQEGWQLWQARQMNEAAAKFNKAVKLDPKNANAWNGLGWATFNSGKRQEAEKAFQKAVALEPNHPAALNGLGQIYLAQKKYDQAETYLLKAAPSAPAAWYGLARLYLLQGKFNEAAEYAQKVVDSGQGDESANKMLQAAKEKRLSDGFRLMIEPK
jgi:serine/threonine protein kinase